MKKFFIITVSIVVMTTVMSCSSDNNKTTSSSASTPSDAVMTEQSTTNVEVEQEGVDPESVENQDDTIAASVPSGESKGKIVVLDFFATWCGPCKKMAPDMEKMEKKYAGKIEFRKIDVDQEPELAQQYNITGVPTIVVLSPDGNILDSMVGAQTADELDKMFSALL